MSAKSSAAGSNPRLSLPSSHNQQSSRRRLALQTQSFPSTTANSNTTTAYSSTQDLTLETTLHHLTDFLTKPLLTILTSVEIARLRESIAIHLTPKLATSWDINNPSSGCGIRSLIALPGTFPTPLVNAAKDAGIDVQMWAKGMSKSGEWELWVDPGSICFRDGGWAWVDEGFESRTYRQTLHTVWQTPLKPASTSTSTFTPSTRSFSNPVKPLHFQQQPSVPSSTVPRNRHNPRLLPYPDAGPIGAPAVFRIPSGPLPSPHPIKAGLVGLGNGAIRSISAGFDHLNLNSSLGHDDYDGGWGKASTRLDADREKLMEAAMTQGRGARRATSSLVGGRSVTMNTVGGDSAGGGGGSTGMRDFHVGIGHPSSNPFAIANSLPLVDLPVSTSMPSFGNPAGSLDDATSSYSRSISASSNLSLANSENGLDRAPGGSIRSVSKQSLLGRSHSPHAGIKDDRSSIYAGSTRSRTPSISEGVEDERVEEETRQEDGMLFLDGGLMAAIEGSGDEYDEEEVLVDRKSADSRVVSGKSRETTAQTTGSDIQSDPLLRTPLMPASDSRQSGEFIDATPIPATPALSETTITAATPAMRAYEPRPMLGLDADPNVLRGRTVTSGSAISVQPYDGGNVGVLGGGVKLGGQGLPKHSSARVMRDRSKSQSQSQVAPTVIRATPTSISSGNIAGKTVIEGGGSGVGLAPSQMPMSPSQSTANIMPRPVVVTTVPTGKEKKPSSNIPGKQAATEQTGTGIERTSRRRRRPNQNRLGATWPIGPCGPVTNTGIAGAGGDAPYRGEDRDVAAAIASFDNPGRWNGIQTQQTGLHGSAATSPSSQMSAQTPLSCHSPHPQINQIHSPGPPHIHIQPHQTRWMTMGNPPMLGTGINGQPGSGMVLANLQSHNGPPPGMIPSPHQHHMAMGRLGMGPYVPNQSVPSVPGHGWPYPAAPPFVPSSNGV